MAPKENPDASLVGLKYSHRREWAMRQRKTVRHAVCRVVIISSPQHARIATRCGNTHEHHKTSGLSPLENSAAAAAGQHRIRQRPCVYPRFDTTECRRHLESAVDDGAPFGASGDRAAR